MLKLAFRSVVRTADATAFTTRLKMNGIGPVVGTLTWIISSPPTYAPGRKAVKVSPTKAPVRYNS